MQMFDGINQWWGVDVKQFFTFLALLMAVLFSAFIALWIAYTKKQNAIEAELARLEDEEEANLLANVDADKLEQQQRRFSDASDFDVNFKPAPPKLADDSFNSKVLLEKVAADKLRRGSFVSQGGVSHRSGRSAMSRTSTGSRRSRLSRANIMLVEEALALPPEDRQFNEVTGVNDDDFAGINSINASALTGYGSLDGGGDRATKFAQTLLEDALINPQVAAAVNDSGGTGDRPLETALAVDVTKSLLSEGGVKLIDKTFCEQVASREWRFLIIMAIVTIYRTQWYMTATQPYLDSIGA